MRTAIKLVTLLGGGGIAYAIRDLFTTALSAGSVNGTNAEPGAGVRNVTDTGDTGVSITGGKLRIVGDGTWNHRGIRFTPAITRQSGLVVRIPFMLTNAGAGNIGFTTAADVNFIGFDNVSIGINGSGSHNARRNSAPNSPTLNITTFTSGIFYIILRATGRWILFDPNDGADIQIWWWDDWDNTATLYVGASLLTNNFQLDCDEMSMPSAQFFDVGALAIASDSFNRADGSLGSTDGAGFAEASGGSGKTWATQTGTYGVASNKAQASALGGGVAVATFDAGTKDVVMEMTTVRASAGEVGGVISWTDANNHIKFLHDGTNAIIRQLVAGTPTTLVTAAATYSAGAKLRVMRDGTRIQLYYNDVYIGTSNSVNAGLTGTLAGLYTSDTGNTQDSLLCMARRSTSYNNLRTF